jgi:hypothetical protein
MKTMMMLAVVALLFAAVVVLRSWINGMRKEMRQVSKVENRGGSWLGQLSFRLRTALAVARLREVFRTRQHALANIAEGTHDKAKTMLTDAAITTRHLLYKIGSDTGHVAVCGSTDVPIGFVNDEATAAEQVVSVDLLGRGPTKLAVADAAIGGGVLLYVGANGKVSASGTQIVGISLTASGADGELLEMTDVPPTSATPGVAASLFDAHTILYATTDNTPAALTVDASTFVGRKASGNISALTALEAATVIGNGVGRIGYFGGGGAGTQGTNATTAVTLDKPSGTIALHGTQNVAAAAEQSFTFNNSFITANSVVVVNKKSGGTGGVPVFFVTAVAAGSCVITMSNLHASVAETGADLVLSFVVLNAAAS